LQRAARTCELGGSASVAEIDRDLVEWNYGKYAGLKTDEIHALRPDGQLFRDECPDGEMPEEVGVRADHVFNRVRAIQGNVLIFSSGHFLRVLAGLGSQPLPEDFSR
jgi:broad specificity phosphatase PhoE